MGFWKNVEKERIYQGLTRKELAFRANIAYQGIGLGIERDSMPGVDTAIKISKALGVPLEYLLDATDIQENDDSGSPQDSKLSKLSSLYLKNKKIIDSLEKIPKDIRLPLEDMIVRISSACLKSLVD